MTTVAHLERVPPQAPARPIDHFIPNADIRERHEILVHAPADIVSDVARNLDIESLPLVHAIFWLRGKLMRARPVSESGPRGLVGRTRALGWGVLVDEPGRAYISGAVTQPWKADVVFRAVPAAEFAAFAEPNLVKIAWTLETEPLGPALTRFASETRVVATDVEARARFLRYWRLAGMGIVLIRWLVAPAVRREAERRFREQQP
jgi:hypothetical protein